MKRIAVFAAAISLLMLLTPTGARAFGVKDVVSLSQAGVPDSLILEKIRHSGAEFDLSAKDLITLRQANVSDPVVVAMLRSEDRDHQGVWYDGRYWPYDPYGSVGFGLAWYGPWEPYWGPRYGWRGYRSGYRGITRYRR